MYSDRGESKWRHRRSQAREAVEQITADRGEDENVRVNQLCDEQWYRSGARTVMIIAKSIRFLFVALLLLVLPHSTSSAQTNGRSEPSRSFLGVKSIDVTSDDVARWRLPGKFGAVVVDVFPESAAQKAGIQTADIILRVNASYVSDSAALLDQIAKYRPSDVITLSVFRNGQQFQIQVRLGILEAVGTTNSMEQPTDTQKDGISLGASSISFRGVSLNMPISALARSFPNDFQAKHQGNVFSVAEKSGETCGKFHLDSSSTVERLELEQCYFGLKNYSLRDFAQAIVDAYHLELTYSSEDIGGNGRFIRKIYSARTAHGELITVTEGIYGSPTFQVGSLRSSLPAIM